MPRQHRTDERTRHDGECRPRVRPGRSSRARSRARSSCSALLLGAALGCASGGGEPVAAPGGPGVTPADQSATDALNRRISLAAARAATTSEGADDSYSIGPDDQLQVRVFGAEAFSGTYRVSGSGEISMPLIGEVHVAGRTPSNVEGALEERLSERYMRNPNVTVEIAEMQSRGVSVIGAVTTPGVYQVRGRATLLEVLAMAGGLSEAAGAQVLIVPAGSGGPDRALPPGAPGEGPPVDTVSGAGSVTGVSATGGTSAGDPLADPTATATGADVMEVNLNDLLETGDPGLLVRPGDVVQVPPAQLVYVAGEVNRPGGFTLTGGEPITVLQAVALAEGLGSTAASDRSLIVRQREDGSKQEIPVDLEAVLEGEQAAPMLQPSDVLFVPNNQTKSVALGVIDAFVRMFTFRGLIY